MAVNVPERRAALQQFLARSRGEDLRITAMRRLTGGTGPQNWRLDVHGARGPEHWVLRTASAMAVEDSLGPAREFAVMQAAHAAGVRVPSPLLVCTDPAVLGQDFFVMAFLEGTVEPHRLFADAFDGRREAIVEQVGEDLGRLQSIVPAPGVLAFLAPPPKHTALETVAALRAYLDTHEMPHPAIEFGLRWLERNAPPPEPPVLCHGDFRTGNYVARDGRLVGILDWELGHWGDPLEDIGWFCQRFFRFGKVGNEAGGMCSREPLLRGYARATGRRVDPQALAYWDVMANVKWATVSLQQAARYLSGKVDAFELGLVGLGTAEMEMEALTLIRRWQGGGDA